MNSIQNVCFIGLGIMGYPMAGHLATRTDTAVTVFNRSGAKADQWCGQFEGRAARTPAEAARRADIVFVCVGNDDDLRQVLTGADGVGEGVREGAIIVDHTTVSAKIAREMHKYFKAKGCSFIDAPVSGGQSGAEKGQLTVMAGGDEAAFSVAEPVIRSAYAKEIRLLGPSGAGQLTKMVNQICIAGVLQGLSEGLAFGMKAGLDMEQVLGVIGKGAAQSWQMDNRGATMVQGEFDFGFAINWMVKDLGIAMEEGGANGSDLAVTGEILGFYRELQEKGHGRCDTSALIRRLTSFL